MQQLRVTDFSCIEHATLDLSRLNFIIGPQSSGKSLLSKLVYFFNDLVSQSAGDRPISPDLFITSLEKSFSEWFPESSWGNRKPFKIEYEAGPIKFEILRHRSSKTDRVRFHASQFFMEELARHHANVQAVVKSSSAEIQKDPSSVITKTWALRHEQISRLRKVLGRDFSSWQMFVPAGRAFLTSAGKTYSALRTRVGSDQLIATFGDYLSVLRDKQQRSVLKSVGVEPSAQERQLLAETLLGGTVEIVNDDFALETKDGRVIPGSILSSGQQELLPLILMLQIWGGVAGQSMFIEEPEAHLWPDSQSKLIEYIVSMMNSHHEMNRIIITTHSPYVLSKINNLLRAGYISDQCSEQQLIELRGIVKENLWLSSKSANAYAIIDRKLKSIMSEDGLIDAEYLDHASSDIVDEFSSLLEFQTAVEDSRD